MLFFNKQNSWGRFALPGLKRWILLIAIGLGFALIGLMLLLELRPLTNFSMWVWTSLRFIAKLAPPQLSGPLVVVVGLGILSYALRSASKTITEAVINESAYMTGEGRQSILKSLERAHRRGQGPKIVAIGGGTGLSNLLRGIKNYSSNITCIVTVGDDGGSSGRLREELKVVPPGDIRNCIVALSHEEELTTSIFQYRFRAGSLNGHSLGNLFLAALCDICEGDMAKATVLASQILRSSGKVLPSSLQPLSLGAELEDGSVVLGESNIPSATGRITRIFSQKEELPCASPEAVQAILDAELVILGPGSLFTSIVPNLLYPEIRRALLDTTAKKIFVCNLSQDGETRNFNGSDFVQALVKHCNNKQFLNAALFNEFDSWVMPPGKSAVRVDHESLSRYPQLDVIVRPKLFDGEHKHNPLRLARCIMQWFYKRSNNRDGNVGSRLNKNMFQLVANSN